MLPPIQPIPPIPPVAQNRFFNIPSIPSKELLPSELLALGLDIGWPQFVLLADLRFRSDIAGGVIVVPENFMSDLASIPKEVQNIIGNDDPRISAGAYVHDLLCDQVGKIILEDGTSTTLTHTQAAQILAYEAMNDLLAPLWMQDAVFAAVDAFGPQF